MAAPSDIGGALAPCLIYLCRSRGRRARAQAPKRLARRLAKLQCLAQAAIASRICQTGAAECAHGFSSIADLTPKDASMRHVFSASACSVFAILASTTAWAAEIAAVSKIDAVPVYPDA